MKILGNLMFNGRVRARGITALIRQQGRRWSGEIQLPKDASVNKGCFDLVLNDGRRGKVQIESIADNVAYFQGDGDLR